MGFGEGYFFTDIPSKTGVQYINSEMCGIQTILTQFVNDKKELHCTKRTQLENDINRLLTFTWEPGGTSSLDQMGVCFPEMLL